MDYRPKLPQLAIPTNPILPEMSWMDAPSFPNLDDETPSFDLDDVDVNFTVSMIHLDEDMPIQKPSQLRMARNFNQELLRIGPLNIPERNIVKSVSAQWSPRSVSSRQLSTGISTYRSYQRPKGKCSTSMSVRSESLTPKSCVTIASGPIKPRRSLSKDNKEDAFSGVFGFVSSWEDAQSIEENIDNDLDFFKQKYLSLLSTSLNDGEDISSPSEASKDEIEEKSSSSDCSLGESEKLSIFNFTPKITL